MLRLRVISAMVAIPIVLGAVYLGGLWFALLLLLILNLGMREYAAMLKSAGASLSPFIGYLGVSAILALIYCRADAWIFPLIILLFLALFTATMACYPRVQLWESALYLWGIIYLGGLGGFLLLIRQFSPAGMLFLIVLLVGVWANDSFAYFIGIKWGRHKLAPSVSPNKSIEGAVAGIGGTMLLGAAAALFLPRLLPLGLVQVLLLAAGIAVFAQLGDLMESALKRQFKVKDSGHLIPGHGGIMDRIDSVIVAAPFVYYFMIFGG
ncbi:MAG: phosphatidate cytidylyltransferase [Firmicutes bacterium]|jgi:phosphatidate cytidylyltransferase|nr:phosphatidate cytidylyltransferase [Bacillota bacterium]